MLSRVKTYTTQIDQKCNNFITVIDEGTKNGEQLSYNGTRLWGWGAMFGVQLFFSLGDKQQKSQLEIKIANLLSIDSDMTLIEILTINRLINP